MCVSFLPVSFPHLTIRKTVLYLTSVVVYATSVLPSTCVAALRFTISDRQADTTFVSSSFLDLHPFSTTDLASLRDQADFPLDLKTHTIEFASSHLICSVALTGILFLQAGRHWVEADDYEEEEKENAAAANHPEDPSQGARGRKGSKPTEPTTPVRDSPSMRRKGGQKRKVLAFRN